MWASMMKVTPALHALSCQSICPSQPRLRKRGTTHRRQCWPFCERLGRLGSPPRNGTSEPVMLVLVRNAVLTLSTSGRHLQSPGLFTNPEMITGPSNEMVLAVRNVPDCYVR